MFIPGITRKADGSIGTLPALFRLSAATYFGPDVEFTFDEYIFEDFNTWPTDASKYDVMLITGAKEGAYDQHVPYVPVLESYIARNVHLTRFIGISYGHQVIAWGLNPGGGNVVLNPKGWENAAVETTITPEGKRALKTEKASYQIHNHHGDAVLSAPPGTTLVSYSSQTPVQSIISDRVFTNEGHPEYSAGIMNNWGLWDTMGGFYSIPTFLQYLNTRTFLPCSSRLNFLPDAIWLVGKMVGWLLADGKVPSDAEMERGKASSVDFARSVKRRLEKELVQMEYDRVVTLYGGPDRVWRLKEALKTYVETGRFEKDRWVMYEGTTPRAMDITSSEKVVRVAMLIPKNQEVDWPPKFQAYSPDAVGGSKRLSGLLRYAAALYYPNTRFLFNDYFFEDFHNYPDPSTVDLVFITGADDGAYDHHVPYVPEVERYVAENVNKTRFLGVSFGHQIIAWGLNPGGKNVVKNPTGWENGAVETTLTKEGKRALKTEKTSYFVHCHHGDAVVSAPPGTTLVSYSKQTPVQCIISDRVFCNEGHIEYSGGIMENFGLWDSLAGFYTIEKYREFLSLRTHLLCDNRLKYLPDAIWLAGKMVGWISNDGVVPSDKEMEERRNINKEAAKLVLKELEDELLSRQYAIQVQKFGGEDRVRELKSAWQVYLDGGAFDVEKWSTLALTKDEVKTIKVAILLPEGLDWPSMWQVYSPDVAGGIRKRLPALFRLAAARYFPNTKFEFSEFVFEHFETWPKNASDFDVFFVTGAKEGAYDQHVPYVPILEKYIGDNFHKARFIGISYGHQVIAWGLNPGGKNVVHNPHGWENAAVETVLTEEGRRALKTEKKSYFIHNHHGDAVISAPPGTVHVSSSKVTPVQSFISDRVFCNEGHLEYSAGIMENFGLVDTANGLYTLDKYKQYLSLRTHLLCDNRLKFLPDAIWLAGKMVGWLTNDGVVPSDAEMNERRERFSASAAKTQKILEEELLEKLYGEVVASYGGPTRVKALKRAWESYVNGGVFDQSKWAKLAPTSAPSLIKVIKAAIFLPHPGDWDLAWQVYDPQVAGGIRHRLPALYNIAAATYFPEFKFEYTEFIFEDFHSWPKDASEYDLFIITGAKEGAYDQHVPYVPVLEKYIGDNVYKTRFIGISYGHQTIAWGLNPGGKNVIKNPWGWENAAVEVKLTPEGRAALKTSKTSKLGFLPDAMWLAGKMVGWVGNDGVVPTDEELEARRSLYADGAKLVVEEYEDTLLTRAYNEAISRFGGSNKVRELMTKWGDYWRTGIKFDSVAFGEHT
ncbi:hypothetical protein HDU93_002520 [Gonapodya sp. JEL0774]|nr:hypothetical protein HDU93_002520 [Gonapodya sp. JEL0774]